MSLRVGILVGEKGNWTFFREIYADLASRYRTDVHRVRTYSTPLLHGRLNRWAFTNDIARTMRRNDVCFFEWASELLVPASAMPKCTRIVTRLHSYELYAWAPQVHWANVDRIILVSHAMARKFAALYPAHAHKLTVVYNGIELDRFAPPAARDFRFNIGMLCSIHPRKRIYEIVMLIHELKSRGYTPHLHIAGGRLHGGDLDEYYIALHQLVHKLNLTDDVTFYDHVSDTHRWLQMIDIFISNSYWEGQQVALLEAVAAGCFALSHHWDGAEEVLPAANLYLTEGELLAKLIAYSEQPARDRRMQQQQMRALAARLFDIEQTKEGIRNVIESTIAAQGAPQPSRFLAATRVE